MRYALGLLLFPLVIGASPALAKEGLEVCNKAAEDVSVAVGQLLDGEWTSKGWYNIAAGDCAFVLANLASRIYYLRAEGERGAVWAEDEGLCVRPQKPFTIRGAENCPTRGYSLEKFTKVDTGPHGFFTYSITGGTPAPAGASAGSFARADVASEKIDLLDVGDGIYVQGFFSDELSQIVRIDRDRNKVKVRRGLDGTTAWVGVDKVLTREEAQMNDVGRAAVVLGVGAAVIACLLDTEACKESE